MPETRTADPRLHLVDAFTSFRIPASDRRERVAHGKLLRDATPHADLGRWQPTKDRPGVVDIIERTHDGRLPWLLGLRTARMAASPFGLLRGTANLMAWDVAHLSATGVQTTACGDAHIGNIGFYRSPEGALVIDLNDFDEAHPGPGSGICGAWSHPSGCWDATMAPAKRLVTRPSTRA